MSYDEQEPFGREAPHGFPYQSPPRGTPGAWLSVRSEAFADNAPLPEHLSRRGGNVSPPLKWDGVPSGARELVLVCEDPDAPGEQPFLHWLVTGIDPGSSGLEEGRVPPGARQWPNDYGEVGWGGPQPPPGDGPHRYYFRLVAVDAPLDLPATPHADDVERALAEHRMADAITMGTYER